MKTFFVNEVNSNKIQLIGDEHNHLKNVMRLQVGDKVKVVCGNEYNYFCEITEDIDKYNIGYQQAIYGTMENINLMRSYIEEPVHGPYIVESPNFTHIPIRIPGATIGHIRAVFSNESLYYIDSIVFYELDIKMLTGDYKLLERKYTGRFLSYPKK